MKNERLCQGCKKKTDRNNLIKITKTSDGTLEINPSSKLLGRSMYVCKSPECIKSVIKKKRIKNALKYSNTNEIERVERELMNIVSSI